MFQKKAINWRTIIFSAKLVKPYFMITRNVGTSNKTIPEMRIGFWTRLRDFRNYPLVSKWVFPKTHTVSSVETGIYNGSKDLSQQGSNFYNHKDIKLSISPFTVVKPLEKPQVSSEVSSPSAKTQLGVKPIMVDPTAEENLKVSVNVLPALKRDMVFKPLTPPVVAPSPFCPDSLDPERFIKANILATLVLVRQAGVPLESALLCCSFMFDTPGQVINMLAAVSKLPNLNDPLNLIPFLPSQAFHFFTEALLKEFSMLKATQFGRFYEAIVGSKVSYGWQIPFKFYTPNTKHAPLLNGGDTQNLTGQPNPDFVRDFDKPIFGIVKEAYDQKGSTLPLRNLNHIRPVLNNLGNVVDKAKQDLYEKITLWQNCAENLDDTTAIVIQQRLLALSQAYVLDGNAEIYAELYNKLRDDYTPFFLKSEIRMNLVVQIGVDHFVIDADHVNFVKATFADLYNSPNSPVIVFFYDYLAKNNGVIPNFTVFLYKFAQHLMAPTLY